MGRKKLEIEKINDPKRCKTTYSKRSKGLIKKAYELSTLCDADIALIMFSQSGKLEQFCNNNRIEDAIIRYANTPLYKRIEGNENSKHLANAIQKLNDELEMEAQDPTMTYMENHSKAEDLQATLEKVLMENQASTFPSEECITGLDSIPQLEAIERKVKEALVNLQEQKKRLNGKRLKKVSPQNQKLDVPAHDGATSFSEGKHKMQSGEDGATTSAFNFDYNNFEFLPDIVNLPNLDPLDRADY